MLRTDVFFCIVLLSSVGFCFLCILFFMVDCSVSNLPSSLVCPRALSIIFAAFDSHCLKCFHFLCFHRYHSMVIVLVKLKVSYLHVCQIKLLAAFDW